MIPKVHQKRSQFKGVAAYLLHDPGARTAERVAWTENRNVASRNPDTAWRVMAATAMDQDRLKREAGIPNTGRKTKTCALHVSLSWHAEEAPNLTRQEMMRAANTILRVMDAQDHQALIVCHTDRPQPHVHILVNRVNPKDGRILSSSFEKLNASRWAQKYEEERGKIYCEQRVLNNAARDRGERPRGEKEKPRHLYEACKLAGNDNERRQQIIEEHRRKAAKLKEAERRIKARHAQAWQRLETVHKHLRHVIDQKAREVIGRNKIQIRERYRPRWESLYHEHQAELRAFEQREAAFKGRVKNALQSFDLSRVLRHRQQRDQNAKGNSLAEAFKLIGSAGARKAVLQRHQEAARRELALQQRREERAAEVARAAERLRYFKEARHRYADERASLLLGQSMDQAKLRAQWREKGRQLRDQVRELRRAEIMRRPLAQEFAKAAGGEIKTRQDEARSPAPTRPRTNPADLLPKKDADQAAKQIDQWEDLIAKRLRPDRNREKSRDDDRER